MKLQIFSKDIELTEKIKDLIEEKLVKKLQKFFKSEEKIRVTISHGSRWGYRVKFEANNVFAENKHKELHLAISGLSNEVKRILRKNKEKNLQRV